MKPQTQAEWNESNDLEPVPGEPLPEYVARSLAFMFHVAGSEGRSLVASLARAAKVPAALMLEKIQERRELERSRPAKVKPPKIPKAVVPVADPYEKHPPVNAPNITTIDLPAVCDVEDRTICRCGKALIELDWSNLGMKSNPLACPGCRDLPMFCACA